MEFINNKNIFFHIFDKSSPVFASRLSLVLCIFVAIFQTLIGYIESSLAVQTNGIIASIEILNSILFLSAVNQTIRTPDVNYNYGYGKHESLSVLAGTLLLSLALIFTLFEVIKDFANEKTIGSYYILLGSSLISYILYRQMSKYQTLTAKKFQMPMFEYDAAVWKVDSYIELGVIANLIAGALLGIFHFEFIAKIIDSVTAIVLILYSLKVPIQHGKEALDQLLDRTLPEHIQFDILAAIAENINRICEFKTVHTRRSGKDIFIEIDVVLPFDFTLEEAYGLENEIKKCLVEKYPTAVPRLYVTPCEHDCIHYGKNLCPVKLSIQNINKRNEGHLSDTSNE